MAIAGESISVRVLEFRQQTRDKFVPAVSLSESATPEMVVANQEKMRDAYWQVMYWQTMDRIKRDLEFVLNTQEPGSVSHEAIKSELFVEKGCFWFPYLTPEKRKELEAMPVAITRRERSEGLTLPEKKKQRLDRKAYLLNRERKINWQRGVDKSIWKRLNNRFFLESKGVVPGDIDEELSKGFLETFDRDEEMYNFLLGVGWNQTLVDIFDFRRGLVEEAREIMSRRMFKKDKDGKPVPVGPGGPKKEDELVHFDELKIDEDKVGAVKHVFDWGDAGAEKFGNTRELMRAVRVAQGAEKIDPDPKNQPKALGLIYEKLLAKATTTKLDTFDGFDLIESKKPETKKQLKERLREQLNNRAQVLFGDDFLNLENEEQIMTAAGPGTILSLEEIMDFLSDYQVPYPYDKKDDKENVTLIRPESVDLEYAYWIKLGWVGMIGPWRLADRINKIIFSYSAREDQNVLQRQQVESAGMNGFGKYVYFDWDYYEVFHGAGGEGGRKRLLDGTVNKVEWPAGFWAEYQTGQTRAYRNYVAEAEKENATRGSGNEKRIVNFDEFSYGVLGVGDYKHIAKEWFLSGWRLIAEGVYLRLRGDAVEQGARRNAKAEQIDETLDGDVMGQKITHAGKEVLVKRYLDAKRSVFLDLAEMIRCWGDKTGHKYSRFREAFGDLVFDKFLIDFMLTERELLGFKLTFAGLANFIAFGGKAITNIAATKAIIGAFTVGNLVFKGFQVGGGLWAALPWFVAWGLAAGGIELAKDRIILRKGVGEKKWAETQKKMNERFKALAENPQRTMIESGWDSNKASVDTHEPIKII